MIHGDVREVGRLIFYSHAHTHIHNDPLHMILPRRSFPNYTIDIVRIVCHLRQVITASW